MIKVSDITDKKQIQNLVLNIKKAQTDVVIDTEQITSKVSSISSKAITSMQKALLYIKENKFNRKNQQSMTEITCNHWTFANIESLIKALKSGKKIQNSIALDSVLPKDINKVLNEQMNCMSAI